MGDEKKSTIKTQEYTKQKQTLFHGIAARLLHSTASDTVLSDNNRTGSTRRSFGYFSFRVYVRLYNRSKK